jgi:transposase
MSEITTIGLDLAESVFQVHGIDDAGGIVLRKRLRRGQVVTFFAGLAPCLVGLEACATAHYWARELRAVGQWHKNSPTSQRLATIPGIGPIIATAVAATIADPGEFRSGREFAAWLGFVPRQNSTGAKRGWAGSANGATAISGVS